jgi:hypothetical protein
VSLLIVLEIPSWNNGGRELNVRFLSICLELQDGGCSSCTKRCVLLLYVSTQILDITCRQG